MVNFIKRIIITLKTNRWILVVIPFFMVMLYFSIIYKSPLYIIHPTEHTIFNQLELKSASDQQDGGKSTITITKASSSNIHYKYILREFKDYSKANIRFSLKNNEYFNLSKYNYLNVKIKATKGTRIPFCISSFVPEHSIASNENSYIYASENINITNTSALTELPLNVLTTPDWWYISQNKTEADFDKPDFSKVKYIYFSNCINLKKNVEDEVTIDELSFHVNLHDFYWHSSVFLLLYFSLYFLISIRKKKNYYSGTQEIYFQYKKIEASNHHDKEEEMVLNYLAQNYIKPDLTIIEIQNEIGIHERKISQIIKNKTGLTFKQYLNILRIEEAKVLLKTTSFPIAEIGLKVGYGNSSHFNRVFKEMMNCSPNDFRKEGTM